MGIATQNPWAFQFGSGADLTAELEAQALGPMALGLVEKITQPDADIADIFLNGPEPISSASAFLFAGGFATTAARFGRQPNRHREAMLASGVTIREGSFDGEQKSGTIIELGHGTIEEISETLALSYLHWFEGKEIARASENVRIVLPDDLAQRILHWGYREQGALYEDQMQFRRLIQKRLQGQELNAEDESILVALHQKYQTKRNSINNLLHFWRVVLREIAFGTSSSKYKESPLVTACHDVGAIIRQFRVFESQTGEFEKEVAYCRSHPEEYVFNDSAGGTLGMLLLAQADMSGESQLKRRITSVDKSLFEHYTLNNDFDLVVAISNLFLNLFTNIHRYADPKKSEGPVMTFGGSLLPKGSIAVTIGDNGIGIKKENLARLGEEGFCEERKFVEGSQGIGLSSVIATLNSLGVPLWVRSEEGVGTEFRFLLPGWLLMKNGEPVATREDFAEDLAHALEQNGSEGFVIPVASKFSHD